MIKLNEILDGYSNRISTIGSYYFLVSAVINRNKLNKFSEFTNEEFFNLTIQLLCFIFEKSLKRENCLKEDLYYFIESLNLNIYKKNISSDDISLLVGYLINRLTNNGKVYEFDYYDFNKETFDKYTVQLIQTEQIKLPNNNYVLSYSLTNKGYKLLLSTKEYDEMFHIELSQIIARVRIEKGDYAGAKEDIQNIIEALNIQYQKIDDYIKAIKNNIYYIKEVQSVDIFNDSMILLESEIKKYDELKKTVEGFILDKETCLNNNLIDNENYMLNIRKELSMMKSLIEGVDEAKHYSFKLINRIQAFRVEYSDIWKKLLKRGSSSKFSFKDVVQSRIESPNLNFSNLFSLYKPLFLPKVNNVFCINTPYQEQRIKNYNQNDKVIEYGFNSEDIDNSLEDNNKRIIEYNQSFYLNFIKELFYYGLKHIEFSTKEFLNYYLKEDRNKYIELTQNALLLRDLFLNICKLERVDLDIILEKIDTSTINSDRAFQIERIIDSMINCDENFIKIFKSISFKECVEEITINSEIDIENMTAIKLTVPNIKVTVEYK